MGHSPLQSGCLALGGLRSPHISIYLTPCVKYSISVPWQSSQAGRAGCCDHFSSFSSARFSWIFRFSAGSPLTGSYHHHLVGQWLLVNVLSSLVHAVFAHAGCWHPGNVSMLVTAVPSQVLFNLVFSFWNLKDAETFGLQIVKTSSISNCTACLVCTFEATGKTWLSGARRAVPPPAPWVLSWGAGA